jgi:hypothetical protein
MSQSGTLSERAMGASTGIDTRVYQEPPFSLPSQAAEASRPFSQPDSVLKGAAATKAIKATKPPQGVEPGTQIKGTKIVEPMPVLFPDGRRLHRFRTGAIPSLAPGNAAALLDRACSHGAVLVADGCELIVVERRESTLPPETLRAVRSCAGAIIAALRGESRRRCAGQEGSGGGG